jgi:hypothetical protein
VVDVFSETCLQLRCLCAVIRSNVVLHFSCFPPKIAITKRCEALYVRCGVGYRVQEVSILLCLCETNTVTQ